MHIKGKGIFLTRTFDNVPTTENVVAQVYIKKPMLLDGFKFDLRIYCLVTSVKPLRMHLYEDGLVRLATERYVKPTKANLDHTCMHLTNYAVNKLNANFHRADEGCEDSSKRALLWFMDFMAEKYGQAKTKHMWKRIGTLCVRTVLSILPTLSREYDQHFRDFDGIPLRSNSAEGVKTEEEGCKEEEDEGEEETETGSGKAAGAPCTRGSRCFEILGLDIMVDQALRPTLIEVNHLPSFGTDSPLDLDIKRRLMEQVLPALSVQYDDEAAYNAFHKQEAEKRLTSERQGRIREMEREQERLQLEERARLERRRRWKQKENERAIRLRQELLDATARAEQCAQQAQEREDSQESCSVERIVEIKGVLAKLYEKYSPEKLSKIDKLLFKYQTREEEFLRFALEKYCPTFLLDMAVSAIVEKDEAENMMAEAELQEDDGDTDRRSASGEEQSSLDLVAGLDSVTETKAYIDSDRQLTAYTRPPKRSSWVPSKSFNQGRSTFGIGRSARSLSPAVDMFKRPNLSNWKDIGSGTDAAEDAALRAKFIAQYVPSEDDEWLKYETRLLTQFTRIFPPMPDEDKSQRTEGDSACEEEETYEEEEEDDEVEEGGQKDAKFVPASFEEIIVHVFMQDKRQTMRLHGPLRAAEDKARESQSLPPISHKPSPDVQKHLSVSLESAEKRETKALSLSQMEAANRLSKGMTSKRVLAEGDSIAKDLANKQLHEEIVTVNSVVLSTVRNNNLVTSRNWNAEDRRITRFEQSRLSPPIMLAANPVKQQLFHFDSNIVNTHKNEGNIAICAPTVHADIGNGIIGRSLTHAVKVRSSDSNANPNSEEQILNRRTSASNEEDRRGKEGVLRNLFPGFF